MSHLDPRLTPARPDLASTRLKGRVEAERFVDPVSWQAVVPAAAVRKSPTAEAAMDDQVLFGGRFEVLEEGEDNWGWGQSVEDGYVGWVHLWQFVKVVDEPQLAAEPDHQITALRTYLFSEPDLKTVPNALLSLNSRFRAGRTEGRFVEAVGLGWVFAEHAAPLGHEAADFVAVAEAFLGAPYLWGGKESLGLDCSGLVQMALRAAGVTVPRDADQQEAWLGEHWQDVTADGERRRGDIVFWPGHVGIMTDSEHLLHANAHTMDTTLEPFAKAEQRIRLKENPVRSIVRPPA